jgi:hypothetical protein
VSFTLFVAVEVFHVTVPSFAGLIASVRILAVVAVLRVIVVVNVAGEVLGTMEPWARSDKDTTVEPFGTVVAVGCTTVGRSIVVAVGARGGYADANGYLCFCCFGSCDCETQTCECKWCKKFKATHVFHLSSVRERWLWKSCASTVSYYRCFGEPVLERLPSNIKKILVER